MAQKLQKRKKFARNVKVLKRNKNVRMKNALIPAKLNTKGITILKAKNTVDDLTDKLSRFRHGFEVPASITKKIKQRRLSEWNENSFSGNDENGFRNAESYCDELNQINQSQTQNTQLRKKKRKTCDQSTNGEEFDRNNFISPKRVRNETGLIEEKSTGTATSTPMNIQTVHLLQTDTIETGHTLSLGAGEPLLFWNVKANSFSQLMFNHFEIKSQSEDKTKLFFKLHKCKLCPLNKQLLSCVKGNNSNLKAHLKSVNKRALYIVLFFFEYQNF